MKNFLAPIKSNKVVSKVTGEICKFYTAHESAILAGGSIGFSLATTAVTLKNAGEINNVINEAKSALACCNTQEEKNSVYGITLKKLTPLVAPILIFQSLTIGTILYSKKQSDKKIAELAGALSIAQQAVIYYQNFQKEAEQALGEKKYEKLQNDICKNQEVDGRRFTSLALEGAPGEQLFIDQYSGRPFWCTYDRIENAARELSRMIGPNGTCDMVTIDDFYGLIGNIDLTSQESELATRFGYVQDSDIARDGISAHFSDEHYIFPNGTRIQCAKMYLYPEPGCVDWGC